MVEDVFAYLKSHFLVFYVLCRFFSSLKLKFSKVLSYLPGFLKLTQFFFNISQFYSVFSFFKDVIGWIFRKYSERPLIPPPSFKETFLHFFLEIYDKITVYNNKYSKGHTDCSLCHISKGFTVLFILLQKRVAGISPQFFTLIWKNEWSQRFLSKEQP